ncbi:YciI family protein [Pseudonocardia sp. GCM10023141]|uniref:YciI family protein n=1 Tax=Pseudonocardia sp. GCM10023141 TaxID=3252653 RepID=UPI0036157A7B
MQYLMLICGDVEIPADVDMPGMTQAWVDEMTARGVRITGDRLRPVADTTTVRVRGGEVLLTDGPFAEGTEQIGGFDLLECADLDEAIEIAAKHPIAAYAGIEVRPLWT